MDNEFTTPNEFKTTPRLRNNRYRVVTRDGTEVVYADTKEEAARAAARAGHVVRFVMKVETICYVPPRKARGSLLIKGLCGIALMLAPAFAQAECVENEFNRPGTNGGYPTGCFVQPTPVEPSNCIAWDSYAKTTCLKYKDADAEGIVPGEALDENEVLIIEQEVFHPKGGTYKEHYDSVTKDRDGWQVRAILAEGAVLSSEDALNVYAAAVREMTNSAGK